jgi:hypothetical protein
MKTLKMVCLCVVAACSLSAQIPAPTLYYPLDGSLPPVTGVMPVSGAGVFGPGQSGFGLSVVNPLNALRAPDTYHVGAEPGTSDWTLSFWARFTGVVRTRWTTSGSSPRADATTTRPKPRASSFTAATARPSALFFHAHGDDT